MVQKKHSSNLFWGIILVLLGLVFLMENFGFDIWDQVIKLWPIILIVWGLSKLQAALKSRSAKEALKEAATGPEEEKKPL